MKDIAIGYIDYLPDVRFISKAVINNDFLRCLGRYADVRSVTIYKRSEFPDAFMKAVERKPDYLYLDSFNFLLESFVVREKFGVNMPFIVKLHSIWYWVKDYVFALPLIRKSDFVYAPSFYARESFEKITKKCRVHVIPNAVDVDFIKEHASSAGKDKNTISYIGRLVKSKGLDVLVESMPGLIDRIGDARLRIIGPLSGSGVKDEPKSRYVARLEDKVKRLGLSERVDFCGARFGGDKYKILSSSGLMVNPSLERSETAGIVNIEAFACGLAVVAADCPAHRELIRDGMNGSLVDFGKPVALAKAELIAAVARILRDNDLMRRMGGNALKSALKYDVRKIIPKFVSLLRNPVRSVEKSRWNEIKDKNVFDFRVIYGRKMLFFIGIDGDYKRETFSSLYANIVSGWNDSEVNIRRRPVAFRRSVSVERISEEFKCFITEQNTRGNGDK